MYKIEVVYTTGNTFGSNEETREIDDVLFEDLESAKIGLQYIAEHKKLVDKVEGGWHTTDADRKAALEEIASKPWALKSEYSNNYSFSLQLPVSKDRPDMVEIYCFWMGYFERLHTARIVDAGRDELSIDFD